MKFKLNYRLLVSITLACIAFSCELFQDFDEDLQPLDPIFTFEPNKIVAEHCWGLGYIIANDHDHLIVSNYKDIYIFKYDSSGIELIQTIDFNETLSIGSMIVHQSSLLIGHANSDGTGTVYIYDRNGNSWNHSQEIHIGGREDRFGSDIDIYGDIMIIGASAPYLDNFTGTENYNVGRAYIFQCIDGSWIRKYDFTAEHPDYDDQFGTCVGIYDDILLVGSPEIPLHIYKLNGSIHFLRTEDMYARRIAHSENNFLVSGDDVLWSFSLEPDGSFTEHLVNDLDDPDFSYQGEILEMKDSLAIIDIHSNYGEPSECYLFKFANQQWTKEMVFSPDSGENCPFYGMAFSEEYAIVGGMSYSDYNSYIYFRSLTY